jgi:hypothetical protein
VAVPVLRIADLLSPLALHEVMFTGGGQEAKVSSECMSIQYLNWANPQPVRGYAVIQSRGVNSDRCKTLSIRYTENLPMAGEPDAISLH